jgi:hypothetical protein
MLSLESVKHLALATADDPRDGAEVLHEGVIEGFVERHHAFLDQRQPRTGAREKREPQINTLTVRVERSR